MDLQQKRKTVLIDVSSFRGHTFTGEEVIEMMREFLSGLYDLDIFFGGACNIGPYRNPVIAKLRERNQNIQILNPDKGANWTPTDAIAEEFAKMTAYLHVMYIGSETRATVSIMETAAFMLQGVNVVLVLNDMLESTVIKDQSIEGAELEMLNTLRFLLRTLAESLNYRVFDNLDEATDYIPTDPDELQEQAHREISSHKRARVKAAFTQLGYGQYFDQEVLTISAFDPLKAQIDMFMSIVAAYVQRGELTIVLPDPDNWNGMKVSEIAIEGRRWEDLGRTLSPYLNMLLRHCYMKIALKWMN